MEDVSETGSVSASALKGREGDTLLGPSERANLNHCFPYLEFRTTDKIHTPSDYDETSGLSVCKSMYFIFVTGRISMKFDAVRQAKMS
jgi:hypothetical protein